MVGDRIPLLGIAFQGDRHPTTQVNSMAIDGSLNLSEGWVQDPGIPGGYYLKYNDGIVEVSLVTAPKGSGIMGRIAPGFETTYEAWFSNMSDPIGYLTLQEVNGIIRYLREKALDDAIEY